jgi:hypothetical protein
MHTHIPGFISGKRTAVVGASRTNDKYKFGNMAATELKRRGYEVYLSPALPEAHLREPPAALRVRQGCSVQFNKPSEGWRL